MPLKSCPDCGAQVSDAAIVCPQCGFPLRRDALAAATAGAAGRPASSSSNRVGILVGAAAAGFSLLFVGGILAALVIPRFAQNSERAKEKEGEGLLKQVYMLENAYFANNGAYTESFEELKTVGWEEPVGLRYYTAEIASARPGELCVHALPREGSGVRPIRIVHDGFIEPGMRCGETHATYGDTEGDALGVLGDVASGVAAWRRDHGRLPATQEELVEASPRAADDPDFRMGLAQVGSGGFCMFIAPRMPPTAEPLFSLDGGGNVYDGGACAGTPRRAGR